MNWSKELTKWINQWA